MEAMIRGYREYKNIWMNPVIEEQLSCKWEIGNAHDTHAVAICKTIDGELKTVEDVPRRFFDLFNFCKRWLNPMHCHRESSILLRFAAGRVGNPLYFGVYITR